MLVGAIRCVAGLSRAGWRGFAASPVDSSGSHPDFRTTNKAQPIADYQKFIDDVHFTQTIKQNKVVLFMKGTPEQPQCGFSQYVIDVLKYYSIAKFKSLNVLDDAQLREEVKKYSNWQTYPQLYVDQELVGGCDILADMHKNDQLTAFFQKHNCT